MTYLEEATGPGIRSEFTFSQHQHPPSHSSDLFGLWVRLPQSRVSGSAWPDFHDLDREETPASTIWAGRLGGRGVRRVACFCYVAHSSYRGHHLVSMDYLGGRLPREEEGGWMVVRNAIFGTRSAPSPRAAQREPGPASQPVSSDLHRMLCHPRVGMGVGIYDMGRYLWLTGDGGSTAHTQTLHTPTHTRTSQFTNPRRLGPVATLGRRSNNWRGGIRFRLLVKFVFLCFPVTRPEAQRQGDSLSEFRALIASKSQYLCRFRSLPAFAAAG